VVTAAFIAVYFSSRLDDMRKIQVILLNLSIIDTLEAGVKATPDMYHDGIGMTLNEVSGTPVEMTAA
jgi:hypothetical protein